MQNVLLLASYHDHPTAARLLLSYQSNMADTLKVISEDRDAPHTLGEQPRQKPALLDQCCDVSGQLLTCQLFLFESVLGVVSLPFPCKLFHQ